MSPISRRKLLKQLAAAGLVTSLPAPFLASPVRDALRPLASHLTAVFSHAASAAVIGRRYLALYREEADAAVLVARVAGNARNYLRLADAAPGELRALLGRQQRQDFAAGRTVTLDGWILSRTEARLCALVALDRPQLG